MESCHTESFLQSPAAQRLATFVQTKREQWAAQGEMTDVPAFERFGQELHTLVMALVHVGANNSLIWWHHLLECAVHNPADCVT